MNLIQALAINPNHFYKVFKICVQFLQCKLGSLDYFGGTFIYDNFICWYPLWWVLPICSSLWIDQAMSEQLVCSVSLSRLSSSKKFRTQSRARGRLIQQLLRSFLFKGPAGQSAIETIPLQGAGWSIRLLLRWPEMQTGWNVCLSISSFATSIHDGNLHSNNAKGKLLFSSVKQVKLIHVHWLCFSSKMHNILAL